MQTYYFGFDFSHWAFLVFFGLIEHVFVHVIFTNDSNKILIPLLQSFEVQSGVYVVNLIWKLTPLT